MLNCQWIVFTAVVGIAAIPANCAVAAAPKADAAHAQATTIDPASEIYEINEARRLSLIARQLDLNNRMIWSSGYGPAYPGVFEPWPRVEGDIYGYRLPAPIAQPVGFESGQIGPNRWMYRPVYRIDAISEPMPVIAPDTRPASQPAVELPAPSDLGEPQAPRPWMGKPPAKNAGPREF